MSAVIELELGAGPTPGTFSVHVLKSIAGGEPSATISLDIDDVLDSLPQIESSILASSVSARRVMSIRESAVQSIGVRLFDAVFTGRIGEVYRASSAVASERGLTPQLTLRLTAPRLAALPWEALYDSEAGRYVSRKEPLVRRVSSPYAARLAPVAAPLRILAMVSSPRGLEALDVEAEKERLESALAAHIADGSVELVWLADTSWGGLHSELLTGKWHVLHFIGHGGYDDAADEGLIALVGRDGRADFVSASSLADLLNEASSAPRLVVLNSCQSGSTGTSDLFAGTAATLVHSGINAVVAMQFAVSDYAALAFARSFYIALASGRRIDEAVRSGRIGILGITRDTLEWITPVLYLGGDDTSLLDASVPVSTRSTEPAAVAGPGLIAAADVVAAVPEHVAGAAATEAAVPEPESPEPGPSQPEDSQVSGPEISEPEAREPESPPPVDQPSSHEPTADESAQDEPAVDEPGSSETAPEPSQAEPPDVERSAFGPAATVPASAEPASFGPAPVWPATPEAAAFGPVTSQSGPVEPAKFGPTPAEALAVGAMSVPTHVDPPSVADTAPEPAAGEPAPEPAATDATPVEPDAAGSAAPGPTTTEPEPVDVTASEPIPTDHEPVEGTTPEPANAGPEPIDTEAASAGAPEPGTHAGIAAAALGTAIESPIAGAGPQIPEAETPLHESSPPDNPPTSPPASPLPSSGEPPGGRDARRRRILVLSAVGGAALLAAGAVAAILFVNAGAGTRGSGATTGPQASQTSVAPTPIHTSVAVPAAVAWTKTGVDCAPGIVIDVAATGSVVPGNGITNGPNGLTSAFLDSNVVADVQHAALLGRLGGGDPFFIGSERTVICPGAADELELGINDKGVDNNEGTFDAVVTTRPDVDPASLALTTIKVPGAVAWTPSGITCVTGDSYRVSATGIVTFAGATDDQDAGPDGLQPAPDGTMQPGNVLRTASHRGLIARVGEGDPFAAGSSVSITCPADGPLEFGPNDAGVGDNIGAFAVTITRSLPALP
ncbi:CHAT domain-containing protein [Microbacterium deminutum]|uniref:CHAT domain-containing protein n=1 Tax=Microbacterium deminutum TaxID=344164 RepID=A0ABN2QLT1_9MICO